jgi:hypothetical protein
MDLYTEFPKYASDIKAYEYEGYPSETIQNSVITWYFEDLKNEGKLTPSQINAFNEAKGTSKLISFYYHFKDETLVLPRMTPREEVKNIKSKSFVEDLTQDQRDIMDEVGSAVAVSVFLMLLGAIYSLAKKFFKKINNSSSS